MMMQSEHFPLVELTITCRVTGIEEGGVVVHRRVWGLKVRRKRRFGGRRSRQTEPLPLPISNYQTPPHHLPHCFLLCFFVVIIIIIALHISTKRLALWTIPN